MSVTFDTTSFFVSIFFFFNSFSHFRDSSPLPTNLLNGTMGRKDAIPHTYNMKIFISSSMVTSC